MRPPEERLARLLERHQEFYAVGADDPAGAIIRRDELLVGAQHANAVEESARRWTDRRTNLDDLGVARFRLRGDADVPDLIATHLSPATGDALASPVHMFRGEPNYQGGPGGVPSPVPALADPPPAAAPTGVTVAILDTGLDGGHPWFRHRPWDRVERDVADRLDTDNDYELDAQAGHGTFIAGVVRQHAPDAALLIGRVLGSDGICDEVDLLRALHAVHAASSKRRHPVGVLNLSLGAYTWNDRPPLHLAQALARLTSDAVVVAAAGNNSSTRLFWPAAFDDVVGVGALSADGSSPAAFSNSGPWVDAWAPGEQVTSSFVTYDGPADEAPGADIDRDCFSGFASWSGTSFAAPQVAAALAARASSEKRAPRAVLRDVLADFSGSDAGPPAGSGAG